MRSIITLFLLVVSLCACSPEPEISPDILGGGTLFDPSLYQPDKYLVSVANPTPTPEQAGRPVIIACHGYTASTFEWDELRAWAGADKGFYLSQVLLGGHGRSYAEFKESSWLDWQKAITQEYERLEKAGYQNINLLGSSTSGALLLQLVSSGYFQNRKTLKNLLLVDPIIVPSDKTLSLVGVLGPMLGYTEADQSASEDKVFYRFRPQETLQELNKLIKQVRKDLEKGIQLPAQSGMKVYKSKKDSSADPVSAVLIYNGVRTAQGKHIEVEMVESDLHVYTRLDLREDVTVRDRNNQLATFADMASRVLQ
jgi:carboxylesterase